MPTSGVQKYENMKINVMYQIYNQSNIHTSTYVKKKRNITKYQNNGHESNIQQIDFQTLLQGR